MTRTVPPGVVQEAASVTVAAIEVVLARIGLLSPKPLDGGPASITDGTMGLRALMKKSDDASFLREMIGSAAEREMGELTGAAHAERSPDRLMQRYRHRDRDRQTRAGTVELRIPKLLRSSCFPLSTRHGGGVGRQASGRRGHDAVPTGVEPGGHHGQTLVQPPSTGRSWAVT